MVINSSHGDGSLASHNEVKFEKVEETLEFVDEEMKNKFEAAQSAQESSKIFHHQLEERRAKSVKDVITSASIDNG